MDVNNRGGSSPIDLSKFIIEDYNPNKAIQNNEKTKDVAIAKIPDNDVVTVQAPLSGKVKKYPEKMQPKTSEAPFSQKYSDPSAIPLKIFQASLTNIKELDVNYEKLYFDADGVVRREDNTVVRQDEGSSKEGHALRSIENLVVFVDSLNTKMQSATYEERAEMGNYIRDAEYTLVKLIKPYQMANKGDNVAVLQYSLAALGAIRYGQVESALDSLHSQTISQYANNLPNMLINDSLEDILNDCEVHGVMSPQDRRVQGKESESDVESIYYRIKDLKFLSQDQKQVMFAFLLKNEVDAERSGDLDKAISSRGKLKDLLSKIESRQNAPLMNETKENQFFSVEIENVFSGYADQLKKHVEKKRSKEIENAQIDTGAPKISHSYYEAGTTLWNVASRTGGFALQQLRGGLGYINENAAAYVPTGAAETALRWAGFGSAVDLMQNSAKVLNLVNQLANNQEGAIDGLKAMGAQLNAKSNMQTLNHEIENSFDQEKIGDYTKRLNQLDQEIKGLGTEGAVLKKDLDETKKLLESKKEAV